MSGCCILSSVSSNHSQSVHPSHSPCHPSMDGHATNTTRSPWWVSLYCIHCDTRTIRWAAAEAEFIIPFIIMQSVFTIFIYLKKLNQDCNFYLHSNFTVNLNNTSGRPRLTPTNIKKNIVTTTKPPPRIEPVLVRGWVSHSSISSLRETFAYSLSSWILSIVVPTHSFSETHPVAASSHPSLRSVEWLSDGVNSWLQVNKKWQRQ